MKFPSTIKEIVEANECLDLRVDESYEKSYRGTKLLAIRHEKFISITLQSILIEDNPLFSDKIYKIDDDEFMIENFQTCHNMKNGKQTHTVDLRMVPNARLV